MKSIVLSTSSPQAAVAVLDGSAVVAFQAEFAPRQAEAALFQALNHAMVHAGVSLAEVEGFIADVGPGSFTGVRVGVTVTKTLAWALGLKVSGVSSFDLIADGAVAVPSRREMYLLRNESVTGVVEVPAFSADLAAAAGYGKAFPEPAYPDPRRVASQIDGLRWVAPEELLPWYVLEPGISEPKTPYPRVSE
ncbi:MAG: tRNA (adenosine(37)-N6)-threonylcarbamoyltransferase complex dimerization subunit type 1 TsaB [Armatimonadota bacterium]